MEENGSDVARATQARRGYEPGDREVRLETELARVGREHLAAVEPIARSESAVKHGLDEELSVEVGWSRVERSAGNGLSCVA